VAVVEHGHKLLKDAAGQGLADATAGAVDKVGIEGAAADKLHDDEDALPGAHDLMDAHDVGMAHLAYDINLAHYLSLHNTQLG
jgi:hypothetical protein